MSKATFALLTTVGFVVATLAIGIRGVENWEPYEFSFYYLMLGWAAHEVYRRRFSASTA
ncbi:hypothetical protein [Rubrivirga marina]|uniref:hypothetical protein n=1 Tax=Rubrivirga marina TaxID=1196024 RepID=UPI0015C6CBED|nr:hypothetical protein [Rubrivirga marina]